MLNQKVYVDETGLSFFRDKAIITEIVSDANGGYILATGKAKANITYYERSGSGTTANPYEFTEKTGLIVGESYVGDYYVKVNSSNINNTTSAPSIYGVVDYTNKAISSAQDTLRGEIDTIEDSLTESINTEIGKINESLKSKADADKYLPLTGGTLSGAVIAPSFQTGTDESSYFQTKKMRGEGNANTYYHAVDWGYAGHNQVDFYEHGATWNFHQCQSSAKADATLVGTINKKGWNGGAVLSGTPTAPTATKGTNTTQIATTAFVQTALEDTYTQTEVNTKITSLEEALGTKADKTTVNTELAKKASKDVATTTSDGLMSSTDKSNLDTINGSYIKSASVSGQTLTLTDQNDKTYTLTNTDTHQDISGKEDKSNKVTAWSATPLDTNYPSEKLVKDTLNNKVDTETYTIKIGQIEKNLEDKANSADLATVATSGSYNDLINKPMIDDELSATSTNAVQNKTINTALSSKSDNGHSHAISDITNLQTTLNGKASTSHSHAISDITNLQASLNAKLNEETYTIKINKIDKSLESKADKATTLEGYGITDAYTKAEVNNKLVSSMTYKGSKDYYANLPTEGNVVGDVWNVVDYNSTKTDWGHNYAWNGESWDDLGGNVDLSSYYTSEKVNELLNNKSDTDHTHLYAGSDTAGGAAKSANSATMLTCGNVGNSEKFVYFANGGPVASKYTITSVAPTDDTGTQNILTSSAVYTAIQSAITDAINASY